MRLSLLPNLRQLWRDPRTVQLGTDPMKAVVLEFSDPIVARVLDLLDGSRTEEQVLADAAAVLAVETPDTHAVLNALAAAGLLFDTHTLLPAGLPEPARRRLLPEATALALCKKAQSPLAGAGGAGAARPGGPQPTGGDTLLGSPAEALRRRAAAKILITGVEALVAPIAVTLAGAGIGHVDPTIDGRGRPAELVATIAAAAPETRVAPIRSGTATLVVLIGPRPPTSSAGRWRRAAVLTVGVRDGVVLVGPLVRPGTSPCWRCLELHRNDRDPSWPVLAAQLATSRTNVETCALTTAITGAAYTAEEVLSYVDGRPVRTTAAAVEIGRPGEIRRRSWGVHPRCSCRRRRPISWSPGESG